MATQLPRLTLTLNPEWVPQLNELKREMFYDKPKADMLRYLIGLGLVAVRELEMKKAQ